MAFELHVTGTGNEQAIVLEDTSSGTYAEIFCTGALLNQFAIPFNGAPFNVVDAFGTASEVAAEITNGFKSAKLSPFTCRLNKGEYSYEGKAYKIQKHYIPPHAIHGIIFDAVYTITDSGTNDQAAYVQLEYHYPGTDPGYPFEYTVTVLWQLDKGSRLTVTTTVSHTNEGAIPMADGWHPYFKLDVPVDQCTLQFDSNTLVEFDETLIPTGKYITDNRFSGAPASLSEVFLDNCFAIDASVSKPVCIYSSQHLKLTVAPENSYPYFQIYTPPHRGSIAIENLSAPPDAFNNKIALLKAEPNTPYQFSTSYIIETI